MFVCVCLVCRVSRHKLRAQVICQECVVGLVLDGCAWHSCSYYQSVCFFPYYGVCGLLRGCMFVVIKSKLTRTCCHTVFRGKFVNQNGELTHKVGLLKSCYFQPSYCERMSWLVSHVDVGFLFSRNLSSTRWAWKAMPMEQC